MSRDGSGFVSQSFWPSDDEGDANAAFEGGGFIVAEGSAFQVGPTIAHVGDVVTIPGADFFLGVNGSVSKVAAVVGEKDHEGVAGDFFVVEELQDASDVGIEVVDDRGVTLHAEGFVFSGGFREFVPAPDIGHGRGVAIAFIDEADFAEPGDSFFSKNRPAVVEGSVVFFYEVARDIEWSVRSIEGEKGEEGFPGGEGFLDAFDGVGGEGIGGEPIVWNGFGFTLAHNVSGAGEVINGSAEESVEFLEAVIHGVVGLVPFSGERGEVTGFAEGFGKGVGAAVIGGLGMLVSGEEGGAGDDAHGVDPEIGKAGALA